jgi:hypothetical protein
VDDALALEMLEIQWMTTVSSLQAFHQSTNSLPPGLAGRDRRSEIQAELVRVHGLRIKINCQRTAILQKIRNQRPLRGIASPVHGLEAE